MRYLRFVMFATLISAILLPINAADFNSTLKKAKKGDPEAQCDLGDMYRNGRGVEKDLTQAEYWYQKAADQNSARGQFKMGTLYDGRGKEIDYAKAMSWYLKSAEQGYVDAQTNIGLMYQYGDGVPVDYDKALQWYFKAVAGGDAGAQNNLGVMYEKGQGVELDLEKAVYWYSKAAEQGAAIAQCNLGYMYEYGRGVSQDKEQAKYWYRKAADQNNAVGQFNLGELFYDDDSQQMLYWLNKSAEQGYAKAQLQLGMLFLYEGPGDISKNDSLAVYWFRKLAEQGDPDGQYYLGNMYEYGNGVETDPLQAMYWYHKAAMQKDAGAAQKMGDIYREGKLVVKDYSKAAYWYYIAYTAYTALTYDEREGYSCLQLAELYKKGLGVPQDFSVAMFWYKQTIDGEDGALYPEAKKEYELLASLGIKEATSAPNLLSSEGSDVDRDIPLADKTNPNTFVVIIANENYEDEEQISDVPFALNDGKVFRQYCEQTLGIPAQNIREANNATGGRMKKQVNWLVGVAKEFPNAHIIFYYSGHGVADKATEHSYILPVDGSADDMSTCYKLNDLYSTLGAMPAERITVFIDACFSGNNRGNGVIAVNAKGVAYKAVPGDPKGNMVVFSAAQGKETAYPYTSKQHGMFTYYLLKKLQETKGDVTLQELGTYIQAKVKQQSLIENSKTQSPCVMPASAVADTWQNWKLK